MRNKVIIKNEINRLQELRETELNSLDKARVQAQLDALLWVIDEDLIADEWLMR